MLLCSYRSYRSYPIKGVEQFLFSVYLYSARRVGLHKEMAAIWQLMIQSR
jgi:hypothetical protein